MERKIEEPALKDIEIRASGRLGVKIEASLLKGLPTPIRSEVLIYDVGLGGLRVTFTGPELTPGAVGIEIPLQLQNRTPALSGNIRWVKKIKGKTHAGIELSIDNAFSWFTTLMNMIRETQRNLKKQ